MCGVVGFLGFLGGIAGAEGDDVLRQGSGQALLRCMADTLMLRGPDDGGYWSETGQRIGLGHRRLAIVDLSPAGHQPMVSANGRYVIAFNGEVYNHLELRRDLEMSGLPRRDDDLSGLPRFARNDKADVSSRSPEGRGDPVAWRGHSDTETLLAGIEAWGLEATHEH